MTTPTPFNYFQRTEAALGHRYRLENMVASSRERVLFIAHDKTLNRRVSLRVNFYPDDKIRAWFLREAEALAQLDHPAIRHVYDAGVVGELAYRVGNWIEGESLVGSGAARAASLPHRTHAGTGHPHRTRARARSRHHRRGGWCRHRCCLNLAGRGTVTDLRYCNWTLPVIPPGEEPSGQAVHGA